VRFEVSDRRTADAIDGSTLVLVSDAPHGLNVTHAETFNTELLAFLRARPTAGTQGAAPCAGPASCADRLTADSVIGTVRIPSTGVTCRPRGPFPFFKALEENPQVGWPF
jgi:hypothetical protein